MLKKLPIWPIMLNISYAHDYSNYAQFVSDFIIFND